MHALALLPALALPARAAAAKYGTALVRGDVTGGGAVAFRGPLE